eukprot:TRINITY_DN10393_c0_g4_i2.p1 TRINITY_DN10393_c0_g4~~TRINITY_DN10393_c0_g4_i2.p1  ORF type:complete len:210 (-),score=31.39 TRINITY_DN10393_c0_g4_i2:112-741(-)
MIKPSHFRKESRQRNQNSFHSIAEFNSLLRSTEPEQTNSEVNLRENLLPADILGTGHKSLVAENQKLEQQLRQLELELVSSEIKQELLSQDQATLDNAFEEFLTKFRTSDSKGNQFASFMKEQALFATKRAETVNCLPKFTINLATLRPQNTKLRNSFERTETRTASESKFYGVNNINTSFDTSGYVVRDNSSTRNLDVRQSKIRELYH